MSRQDDEMIVWWFAGRGEVEVETRRRGWWGRVRWV